MALTKQQALETVKNVLLDQRVSEAARLQRIHEAMRPCRTSAEFRPSVQIPADAPPLMRELARKADTNYLPLLVKTFAQVMKVDGYYSESDEGAVDPFQWWQRNRMDSRQTGLVRSALQYGVSYATALPGTYGRNLPGPAISLYSPREMTVLYQDPESDEWPMLAVGVDGGMVTLFDEEMVYRFGVETGSPKLADPALSTLWGAGRLTYLDASSHETGVCPVVRYRDRNLLAGEESLGIVEPLMTINERITESTFQALVTDYFQAFKQRYVLGWVPKNEQEELKAGAARIWYIDEDPEDVTIGELASGAVDLGMRNAAIRDFAAIGQIPAQALGIDGISNISDATLAGLEAAKNREAGEITTSLGESHEQLLRLCSYIDGNQSAADDYTSEARWADMEARSYAQTIDGLVKLVSGLGLDPEIALEDVPGMTEQRLQRNRDSVLSARGGSLVESLMNQSPTDDAVAIKAKVDALGALIRSGAEPESAAQVVGLEGIVFTGAVPVTLRLPEREAAQLEDQ